METNNTITAGLGWVLRLIGSFLSYRIQKTHFSADHVCSSCVRACPVGHRGPHTDADFDSFVRRKTGRRRTGRIISQPLSLRPDLGHSLSRPSLGFVGLAKEARRVCFPVLITDRPIPRYVLRNVYARRGRFVKPPCTQNASLPTLRRYCFFTCPEIMTIVNRAQARAPYTCVPA